MNVISSTQLLIGSSPEEPSSPNVVPRLPEKRLVEPLLEVHKPLGRLPQRTVINFWLDLSLAIVFVLLTGVITIAQTIFPVGPGSEGWTLWGGDLLAWRGLEFGLLSTLALGIIVHVMLHWDWVCQVSSQLVLKRRLAP
ncbi:MAG: hypothetical protein JWM11_3686, partial [Planctomycetaceae bacterium]|nr:hypothetical protein [Planctomycetaceae bacterium]